MIIYLSERKLDNHKKAIDRTKYTTWFVASAAALIQTNH